MSTSFGFLAYDNTQAIDIIGPWEVIATWKNLFSPDIEMFIVSEEGGNVELDNNLILNSHYSFNSAPSIDYLFVPGGKGRLTEVNNDSLIEFIQKQFKPCKNIISICTGAFLLAKASLLNNKKAITYWRALPELKKCSEIIIEEERIVHDGKIWCSGGLSSGIDMALALIADIAGENTAGRVQLAFEYFPVNKIYAKKGHMNDFPPYYGSPDETNPCLPKYIDEILR